MTSTVPPTDFSPVIRVGIVTRNRAEILPQAIDSALAQDWPRVEVWVIDDASTDATPELRERYPQVRWEREEAIIGYRAARNRMMEAEGADFFASLDDDSWFLEPDALRVAMAEMEDRPKLAAIAYDILEPATPERQGRAPLRGINSYIGCGHLLRLTAVREAGYYAEIPGAYGVEEKDLSLKLLDLGWEVGLMSGVHVWHDKSMRARDVPAQHKSGVCNDLAFALRRAPFWKVPFVIPAKFFRHLWFVLQFAKLPNAQRTSFDREIANRHGRGAFLKPFLAGAGAFLLRSPGLLLMREPVSSSAWSLYHQRARRKNPRIPIHPPASVSVTITTRNRSRELKSTLLQLRAARPAPAEIIVCCDGCTDDTEAMLRTEFPYVKMLSHDTWRGSIPSRDAMIRKATGDLIVSLDDDSYPLDEKFFELILTYFRENPQAAVYTFPQITDEFPETLTQIKPSQGGKARAGSFTNSGAALRRSTYLQMPGYCAFFQHAYEEPDYALQCVAAGYDVIHEPASTIRHHYSRVARNERRTHQFHSRNELWSVLLRAPWFLVPPVAAFRVVRQFLYACKRGPAWILLEPRWWWQALKGLPGCFRGRKPVNTSAYLRWMKLVRHPEIWPENVRTAEISQAGEIRAGRTVNESRLP